MWGAKHSRCAGMLALAMLAFLRPLPAQQLTSGLQNRSGEATTAATSAPQALLATALNPFQCPETSSHKSADDADSPDALLFLKTRSRLTTSTAYSFSAPPGFYAPQPNDLDPALWNSSISSVISASLRQSGSSSFRVSGDLENYGQRRPSFASGDAGSQTLTLEWQFAQRLPTRFGAFEVAAGGYQQQLIANRAFAHGPVTEALDGYSVSSAGVETTFTLPDRNLGLTVRYGSEHVRFETGKSRTASFEFSWSW